MRRIGRIGTSWICGLVLLALGACDGSSPTDLAPGRLNLAVALSSSSVTAGQPVTATFTVTNTGGTPVDLVFGDSCWTDLSVASGGAVVWNALADSFCLQSVTRRSLGAGQSLVLEEVWNQTKNEGGRVSPGTYRVFGTLRAGERLSSPEAALTIR